MLKKCVFGWCLPICFIRFRILSLSFLFVAIINPYEAQETQTITRDGLVGFIKRDDLYKVFQGYPTAASNKTANMLKSIFDTFPRLLLPYEVFIQNENQLSLGAKILEKVSDFNQNLTQSSPTTRTPVEIWIVFSQNQGNLTVDMNQMLEATNQANSQFFRTVTTFLLNYPVEHLSNTTAQTIQSDILRTRDLLKSQPTQYSVGVILDFKICEKDNLEYLEEILPKEEGLPRSVLTTVYFNDSHSSTAPRSQDLQNCQNKSGVQQMEGNDVNLGFIFPWPVALNQDTGYLVGIEDEEGLSEMRKKSENATFIIEASFKNRSSSASDSQKVNATGSKSENRTAWLQAPITFSKSFMGVSITNAKIMDTDDLTYRESKYLKKLYENFRKITIGDITSAFEESEVQKLEKFVKELAEFKRNLVRNKSGTGGVDIFEDHVALRVFLTVQITNASVGTNNEAMDKAATISQHGNSVYSDSVSAIVLNCETYDGKEEEIQNETSSYWQRYIQPSIAYGNNIISQNVSQNTSKLDLGIILPTEFCQNVPSPSAYPELDKVNKVIFKEIVPISEVAAGGKALVDKLGKRFLQCRRSVERNMPRSLEVEFRVTPSGCKSENSSNVKEVMELARVWDEFNKWSVNEKSVVTIDTAFEHADKGEHCGWWKAVRLENGTDSGTIVFEDKKRTALRLFEKEKLILDKPSTPDTLLLILLPTMLFVILLTATASYLIVRYRAKYIVGKDEADGFFKGMDNKSIASDPLLNLPQNDGNSTAHCQPYDKEQYELPKGTFKIDTTKKLGSGEFGLVCLASVRRKELEGCEKEVAVKMINDRQASSAQGSSRTLKGLMSEIKILSYVGYHRHIIGLEGAYTAELRRGRVYVFLELCQMGSLESHLRSYEVERGNKEEEVEKEKPGPSKCVKRTNSKGGKLRYVNLERKNVLDEALAHDLLRWAQEICSGMEFLTSKQVVHADLATRNVLLNLRKTAKIADFGLSRRLYDYTNYVKQQQEPLPWRWMAPESLRRLEFNEKTDVWAFGVTLWEIYTLGDQPYPGLSWDANFCACLENGLRLGEPVYKEKNMYEIMMGCWNKEASIRPTFNELQISLTELAPRGPDYVNCLVALAQTNKDAPT